MGGFKDLPLDVIEVYDSASDRWMELEIKLSRGLAYCAAEAVAGRLYVMGGVVAGGVPSRRMEVIDLDRRTVGSGAALMEPRIFPSSAVLGSVIFLFGGKSTMEPANTRLSSCERLDTARLPPAWEAARSMPEGRADAGAAAVRSRIFLVGGFSGQQALSSVVAYSPAEDTWRAAPGMAEARAGPGCAALGSTLYVAGGTGIQGDRLSSVERLEAGGTAWEAVANMRRPRSNFRLVAVGGRLLAVGGYNGSSVIASVECYDPERNLWWEVSGLPRPKSGLATAVVPRAKLATTDGFRYGQREELLEQNVMRAVAKLEQGDLDNNEHDYEEDSSKEEGSGSISISSDESDW
jgi:N-acetylneuraminic acid mutarotase